MKRVWIVLSVFAVLAFAISCEEVEPAPQFKKSDALFSLTSSTTTVAIAATDSLSDAISFTWTDPKYAVGLSKSKFSIQVGADADNFATFSNKDFVGVLTGALLGKEVNAMALKHGGVIGQPITLEIKVVASQGNNNEPVDSNVITVTVTPYGDLTLTPSATAVVTTAATASEVGLVLNWSTAFNGYNGVKTYQLQYAKGGTNFAAPTVVDVTSLTKSFTQFDLNKIALGFGVAANEAGPVDFRIKASNESGTVIYSNTATVSITTYPPYNSIGIIGDATAGGWSTDTDMYRPDANTKPNDWAGTFYLIGGKQAKFRASDSWDNNWGSTDFPNGTGTAGGPNIPIPTTGYYKVTLNVTTGAYTFTQVTTTVFTNVAVIGAATPGGWGADTDLTKDPGNDQIWTGTVALTAGELKFRANHAWTTNWGASGALNALSGYGVQDGPNISITTAGTYYVYINVATGEYFFGQVDRNLPYADIGIIGDSTPGGWGADTNLIKNPANPFKWSGTFTLTNGEAKFRADNAWDVNWGAATFPSGVGTSGGPNIPVSAGTYFVSFNTATGEYTFSE